LSGNFANIELNNIANVAINTSLISDTDDTDDLGSSSKQWKDLFIDGTANIDILSLGGNANFNDNEANNVKGIDFQAGGPADTTTLPVIWADASGDLINNVATGDAFFWSIAGTANEKMRLLEAELQITTPNQNGPDLILTNDDQTPLDNDIVAQIIFKGNDDAPAAANWGLIEFEQNDVSAGAKQGSYKVSCQSDNSLQTIIDFSGSDAVFRFSSGVDVVRPNRDDAIDLGATGQEWKDLWIDGTANIDLLIADAITMAGDVDADGFDIKDLSNIEFRSTTSAPGQTIQAIYADAGGMIYNVPTGDDFDWRINNISEMKLNATDLDLQANNIIDCGNVIPSAAGVDDLGSSSLRWNDIFAESILRDADNGITLNTTGIIVSADQFDIIIGGGGSDVVVSSTDVALNNGFNLVFTSSSLNGYIELEELTGDAAAPATNRARLYCKDSGGKTQLLVRFATGAVQVLATQP